MAKQSIITKIFRFDSAHKLNDYSGQCANLHGHTYSLHISVKGEINKNGLVMDFKDLKETVKQKVIAKLDHTYLNDIIEQPTAENICIWIWRILSKDLKLYEIKLYETPDSYVTYRGE
jgi:6-pyruvoyltetrahydropterin/6-carboxytetrahydropterin synthase